jgi:hypothetical protein
MRERWRETQRKLAALERQQAETQKLLDILLADAVHSGACEVGMHAQRYRREVVAQLFERLGLEVAVETGTNLGNTTNYLARTFDVPVHSSEIVPRYHHAARRMLREVPNAHLYLKDSRSFLRELAAQSEITSKPTFFYLDAHWYEDLPLNDEVNIVAGSWEDFAVLVDDFSVPGDSGYAFDDYGPGKALVIEYLRATLGEHGLKAFFPTVPSAQETGGRSGYVVLVPTHLASALSDMPLLKAFEGT